MGCILPVKNISDGFFSVVDIKKGIIKRVPKFFSGSIERNNFMNLFFPVFKEEVTDKSTQKEDTTSIDEKGNVHINLSAESWEEWKVLIFLCLLLGIFWIAYIIYRLVIILIYG